MKQPPFLVKLAAVASSVLLAGSFISYRAGAFSWLTKPSAQSAEPGELPSVDDASDAMFGSSKSDLMLSGSKYDRIEILPADKSVATPETIMYSTKSGPAFTPGTAPPAPGKPAAPSPGKPGTKP